MSPKDPENPAFGRPTHPLHGKEVIFNGEGKLIEYTDRIFLIEVERNLATPYAFLFKGFEYQWRNYKVFILWLKLFQLVLLSVLTGSVVSRRMNPVLNNVLSSVSCIFSMGMFLFASLQATAYVDHEKDKMEQISKAVLVLTPCVGLIASLVPWGGWGGVLNITTTMGWIGMLVMWMLSTKKCRTCIKKRNGSLDFSDPDGISLWNDRTSLPLWDLDIERKRRLWKPFWDRIFVKDPELSGKIHIDHSNFPVTQLLSENKEENAEKAKNKAKKKKRRMSMVVAHDGSGVKIPYPIQRWEETLDTLRIRGFNAFQSSLLPISIQDMQNRLWLQAVCEGPDIYCDDNWQCDPSLSACKDGSLTGTNGFGRLEVEAYPYCVKIYWDGNGHDHAELPSWNHHAARIAELVAMQARPEVHRKKNVRLWIRGAAACGALLYLEMTWTETKTYQKNIGQDSEGNTKYRTVTYYIDWYFTHGTLLVKGDFGESPWEQGFNVSMKYSDGNGVERGGEHPGKQHGNGQHTFNAIDIGIQHNDYAMTPRLQTLLGFNAGDPRSYQMNRQNVQNGVFQYQQSAAIYRKKRAAERYWDNYALSWSFWYLVYNNDMLTMSNLRAHFAYIEHNPVMQQVPKTYETELTALTQIIARFNSNPAIGYWYLYWHDIYLNNSDLKSIKKHEEVFNPATQKSIAFNPMGRTKCDAFLKQLGNPLGKKQSEHLDRLFRALDEVAQKHQYISGGKPESSNFSLPTTSSYAVAIPLSSSSHDGSAGWAGFANNPVASGAHPSNMAILDTTDGGTVWAAKSYGMPT